MSKIKQLKEQRAAVEAQLHELHTSVGDNKFTTEQETSWNGLTDQRAALTTEIEQLEAREAIAKSIKPVDTTVRKGDSPAEQAEKKKYSYMRALKIASGDEKPSGLEYELSQEARQQNKNQGINSQENGGIIIPSEFVRMEKRAHTAGTNSEGGFAVPTDTQTIIPALNAQPVVLGLGATSLTGLVGDVSFPRNTNTITMGWKAEGSDADEKSLTLEEMLLTPKELTGYSTISKRLMLQTGGAMERFIMQELEAAIARAYDAAAINGSGTSPVPTGILNTSGIGSVAGGTNGDTPTWANIVNLVKEVEVDNAAMGSLNYLTTPGIKAYLSQTGKQSSGVEGNFILNDPNSLHGYGFTASTQVPSTLTKGTASGICHAIIFGNFAELFLAQWGGLELFVDPYSLSKSRQVQIVATLWGDIGVRTASSFAAMKDALIA